MSSYIIYRIVNKTNGKIYIGCTICSINKRWQEHLSEARRKSNRHLHRAINKYGIDTFKIEEICRCLNTERMIELEKIYIKQYNCYKRKYGYNLTKGGEGIFGYTHSKETKEKLSKFWTGRKRKPMSEETKEKIRISNLGQKRSPETIRKMKNRIHKPLTIKTKNKISLALKGRPHSEQHNKNVSKSNTGKKLSEEHKKNISKYWRKRPKVYKRKIINQYSLENKFIKRFKSLTEASSQTGIIITAISNALKNKSKTAGGYIWYYHLKNK